MSERKIVLASRSSSRRRTLELLGLKFEVMPADIDEKKLKEKDPEKRAEKLAVMKAKEIGKKLNDAIIIAADLVVVFDGKLYEKPESIEEAKEMLKEFSGNTVTIIAALAVMDSSSGKLLSTVKKCDVKFRKLEEEEINRYVQKYPVLNFSGAFDGNFVLMYAEEICGSTAFYTGLPTNELVLFLRELGVSV